MLELVTWEFPLQYWTNDENDDEEEDAEKQIRKSSKEYTCMYIHGKKHPMHSLRVNAIYEVGAKHLCSKRNETYLIYVWCARRRDEWWTTNYPVSADGTNWIHVQIYIVQNLFCVYNKTESILYRWRKASTHLYKTHTNIYR